MAVAVMALSAAPALAQTTYTSVQSGPWTSPATWDVGSGYPDDTNDIARILTDGHVVTYNAGTLTINNLNLGTVAGTTTELDIQSGSLDVLGNQNNNDVSGEATLRVSGGYIEFNGYKSLAHRDSAFERVIVTNGTYTVDGTRFGHGGGSKFIHVGGTGILDVSDAGPMVTTPTNDGDVATMTITDSAQVDASGAGFYVGRVSWGGENEQGEVTQSGGTVTIGGDGGSGAYNDDLYIGTQPGAIGVYTISGGSLILAEGGSGDILLGNASCATGLFHVVGSACTISLTANGDYRATGHASDVARVTTMFTTDAGGVTRIDADQVDLGNGNPSALVVDVTARPHQGKDGLELFAYASLANSPFGSVAVIDADLGELTEGAQGSLVFGEYAIDYTTDDKITLYYHNQPPVGRVYIVR
jgi:hypothetical protein